jgi:hypothetical protein
MHARHERRERMPLRQRHVARVLRAEQRQIAGLRVVPRLRPLRADGVQGRIGWQTR